MIPRKDAKILREKLKKIKIFLFDFDGVFTNGEQGIGFNERDVMGINMLRLGYYLVSKRLPIICITTGEKNDSIVKLVKREHFEYLFLGIKDKKLTLNFFEKKISIKPSQIAVVYDDVNDLSVVEKVDLKILVNQSGTPIFKELMKRQKKYDYLTYEKGGEGAVREICELILGLLGIYSDCIKHRQNYSKIYKKYWAIRNDLTSLCYLQRANRLQKLII
ncbi:hypothetical protein AMJ49_05380 [Parcubacteria bacterium DG_74_2]|nr:MAG: hypothetical protein AMJ49_05380 [Parcubacteria bacterium DG_74_2]